MSERWTKEDMELVAKELGVDLKKPLFSKNDCREERMEDFFEKLKAVLTLIAVVVLIILVIIYC